MPTRPFAVDFFQLVVGMETEAEEERERTRFTDILTSLGELALAEREREMNHALYRMETIEAVKDGFVGDMLRQRNASLPSRYKRGEKTRRLGLAAQEDLGEHTAFFFEPKRAILALERHRGGTTHSTFAQFLKRFDPRPEEYFAAPLLSPDAMKKLGKKTEIRSFRVRIANIRPGSLTAHGGTASFREFFRLADNFAAPVVEIKVSAGRAKSGLSLKHSREFLRAAASNSAGNGEVEAAELKGRDPEGVVTPLDLIADKIEELTTCTVADRESSAKERMEAVRTAFHRHQSEIEKFVQ